MEETVAKGMERGSVYDRNGVADGVGDEEGDEPVEVEGVDEVEGVALEGCRLGGIRNGCASGRRSRA